MITRVELRAFGWSDRAIDLQIGRSLFIVHRGVFAVGSPQLTDRGRWMAAVLACGPGAALSHHSAAALWQIVPRDFATHVSVPRGRQARRPGIEVHRRAGRLVVRWVDGIRTTSPLETLVDLAGTTPTTRLTRLVDEADRRGLFDIGDAVGRLREMRRRPGAAELLSVLDGHQRTDSDLERCLLELIRDAGLPAPHTQVELLGFRVDFLWPELRLVVETDGLTYHRTRAQQARDRSRDQRLTAAGYTCLRFTNAQVRTRPEAVIRTLRRVIRRLSAA